jgi:hypothetical protein
MEYSKNYTKVWQVCRCEVTDRRDYCVTCFPSKSAHLLEAMKDEDTFLRYPDLCLSKSVQIRNKNDFEPGIKA